MKSSGQAWMRMHGMDAAGRQGTHPQPRRSQENVTEEAEDPEETHPHPLPARPLPRCLTRCAPPAQVSHQDVEELEERQQPHLAHPAQETHQEV